MTRRLAGLHAGWLVFAALLACAVACTLAFAMPASAHAYDFWYKVYDADDDLLYYSEDQDSAATSIDANTLAGGLVMEAYYNGRVNPLPSQTFLSPSIGVYDENGESLVESRVQTLDEERSDCKTTDANGNVTYQFDEDGYFCGIVYAWTEVTLSTVSPGSQITIVIAMYPYIISSEVVGAGGSVLTCEEQTFTLGVTELADDEADDEQDDVEAGAADDAVVEQTDEGDSDEAGLEPDDESGDGDAASGEAAGSGGTAEGADVVSAAAGSGANEEGTAAETGIGTSAAAAPDADASPDGGDGKTSEEAAGEQATTAADAEAGAQRAQDGEPVTLEALGTVFSLSEAVEQDELADELVVTGWPWLYTLLVLVLVLMAPCGAFARGLRRKVAGEAASRLVGV